jgi:hypothetical protein
MRKIKIGTKTWKFRTSFGEFDCENIKDYMNLHQRMDDKRKLYISTYNSIKPLEDSFVKERDFDKSRELKNLIEVAESECANLQMELHLLRVEFIASLCLSANFKKWALNTKGVNKDIIDACLKALLEQLGSFTDFWDSAPLVENFSLGKKGFFKKKYKVHDMDCTTLYRESTSYDILNRAMTQRSKLDAGYFDDLCKFAATIVRPANQKEEISFNSKSFIKGKKVKGLSSAEKLTYYVEKLEESIEQRTKEFKKLPLSIAVGVIVCYFEKKNRYEKNTSKSTKAKRQL